MCTLDTKLILFNTYCSSLYTAHLWTNYSRTSINNLYIAYHNILKSLIGVNKREHTSPICVSLNVRNCPTVIRNLVFRFISRLHTSNNEILNSICSSSCYYKSQMWKHWRSLLYIASQTKFVHNNVNRFILIFLKMETFYQTLDFMRHFLTF